jgi:D-hydroxyproline dehydrogenase subunit beta
MSMAGGGPYDLAVVGAGIVGMACALAAARRGRRVVVIDRDAQANGASVRNFGFVTVTGQKRGAMWDRACRSRDVWAEVAPQAGVAILHQGLMMAARRAEAVAVLEAFLKTEMGEGCRLLTPGEVARDHPHLAGDGLLAALWSAHELRVESRQAIPRLAAWLAARRGVEFLWGAAALSVETGRVVTTQGVVEAGAVAVCPGDDLFSLFPERVSAAGVTRCKLQMLRLADPGFQLSAGVMSDLGLARYAGYAALPEAEALRARLAAEQPEHLAHGVHLIVVQSADGSLVVGDSHHYAPTPDPFSHQAVDDLILEEYAAVFGRPASPVIERWTGTYASAPDRTVLIDAPMPGVRLVMVTTGAGASTGFALGEEVVADLLNEGTTA